MKENSDLSTIFVYLLDEGTDVWRPVDGIYIEDNVYQINPENQIPETEKWQFLPGDIVWCEEKELIKGKSLVVIEKLEIHTDGSPCLEGTQLIPKDYIACCETFAAHTKSCVHDFRYEWWSKQETWVVRIADTAGSGGISISFCPHCGQKP